jgi:hypothetical protein
MCANAMLALLALLAIYALLIAKVVTALLRMDLALMANSIQTEYAYVTHIGLE